MDIEYLLEQAGLSEKEVEVYMALLPKGQAPASRLATELRIPRSTAKFTCDQLVKKQLVQQHLVKNTTYYVPEHPQRLIYLLNRQAEHIEETKEELERNMGQLSNLYSPHAALPKTRFYQGEEIVEMFDRLAKIKEKRYSFSAGGHIATLFPEAVEKYNKEVAKLKQPAKVFRDQTYKEHNKSTLIQTKVLKTIEHLKSHIVIAGEVVTISSFEPGKSVGIWIEHKQIAEGFIQLFNELWDVSDNS